LEKLLLYVRDWNTNSKHSTIAQTVLNAILGYYDQETLLKLPKLNEVIIIFIINILLKYK